MNNSKYTYDYPANREVRDKLEHGDMTDIARTVNKSYDYVRMVLNGTRNNSEILDVAKSIIASRVRRRKVLQEITHETV